MPVFDTTNEAVKQLKGIHLYHFWLSSCSQRVRIVLAEKGLEWEGHEIDLEKQEHATEEYQSIHPDGLVPAMVHDGVVHIESIDIIDYLDTTYADPPLRPTEPAALVEMHDWMELADDAQHSLKLLTHEFLFRAHPMPQEALAEFIKNHHNQELCDFMKVFASENGFPKDEIEEELQIHHDNFVELDDVLSESEWLVGDQFTLADIAWVPNIHRLNLMQYPLDRHPNLLRWYEAIKQRPSYAAGLADLEPPPAAEAFKAYSEERAGRGTGVSNYNPLAA